MTDTMFGELPTVLRRSLRALSDPFLEAMATGLERHGEHLIPGRLFAGRRSGGCLIGVTLRELDRETYERGPVSFWLRDRWRRGSRSYRGPVARNPRLRHLEWVFDDAVEIVRRAHPRLPPSQAAVAAGRWVRVAVEAELRWRELTGGFASGRTAPSRSPAPAIGGARQ
jgi:hypothetical protein